MATKRQMPWNASPNSASGLLASEPQTQVTLVSGAS